MTRAALTAPTDVGREPKAPVTLHGGRYGAFLPGGAGAGPAAVLALQRSAGNRAVLGLLGRGTGSVLARCPGRCTCGEGCGEDEAVAEDAAGRLRRALARSTTPARAPASLTARSHPADATAAGTLARDTALDIDDSAPDTDAQESAAAPRDLARPRARILARASARQLSCGAGPLDVPGDPPLTVDDPVQVVTDAEDRAGEIMDTAISELDFTIRQIADGAPIGFPTISDSLGQALRIMGLDPDNPRIWRGRGIGTARLLLRRLGLIRSTMGIAGYRYTCIGPARGRIGDCEGVICGDDGQAADASSCRGSFRTVFCQGFWRREPDEQASELIHEKSHNFAEFIQDRGREGNAACYARFCLIVAGVEGEAQRADICPDP